MSECSLAAEIGNTYVFEELQRASDENERLSAENARLRQQVEAADALAEVMDSALPEYEPTEDDADKAWFSIEWVRRAYHVLDAYRATVEQDGETR